MNQEQFISHICKNEYLNLFNSDNIVAVALGNKIMNGIETDLKCIHVYVKEKLPQSVLSSSIIVPKMYKGIMTDVIEMGEIKPLVYDATMRPLVGGYAIGREYWGGIGTYGGPMDTGNIQNRKKNALSNNHVLGGVNTVFKGAVANQTAYSINQNPANNIGTVIKYIPILEESSPLSGNPANKVDCGLAQGYNAAIFANNIAGIGPITDLGIPQVGMNVIKAGRTTETTVGTISSLNATIRLQFTGTSYDYFIEQIVCNIPAAGGDSGALLLQRGTGKLIGLLFAGGGNFVVFNDIRNVLSLLGIKPPISNWGVQ